MYRLPKVGRKHFSAFVKWLTRAGSGISHVGHHRMVQANWNPGPARPSVSYSTDGLAFCRPAAASTITSSRAAVVPEPPNAMHLACW